MFMIDVAKLIKCFLYGEEIMGDLIGVSWREIHLSLSDIAETGNKTIFVYDFILRYSYWEENFLMFSFLIGPFTDRSVGEGFQSAENK